MFNTLQGGEKKNQQTPNKTKRDATHTHTTNSANELLYSSRNKLTFDLREQRELNSLVHMENMTEIQGQKEPQRRTELLLDHCTRIHKAVIILTSQNIVQLSGSGFVFYTCRAVNSSLGQRRGISNLSNSNYNDFPFQVTIHHIFR